MKWLMRYDPLKRVTTAGRPAAHTQKYPLIYERLRSLRSLRNNLQIYDNKFKFQNNICILLKKHLRQLQVLPLTLKQLSIAIVSD